MASQQGSTEAAFFIGAKGSDMEDFSFERLLSSQSSKREKKQFKRHQSQSEIIFFLSKKWQNFTFKTICKSFDRLSCEWPFCWE